MGFAASAFIGLQIRAELVNSGPSSLSVYYVVGFLTINLFWFLYGLKFRRIAIWLTNLAASGLQAILLALVLQK